VVSVSIRVPRWAGLAVAPVAVFLIIWTYHACTPHHPAILASPIGSQTDSSDPQTLLAVADHFYWLNNGPAAGPFYEKAEKLFSDKADARNALHAKIGRLRSNAETMSFVDLSRFLGEQLQKPGEWRVSIVGSRAKEDWEMKVEGPNGFERSYTLVGTAGEHQPAAIGNLLLRLLPSKTS